MTVARWVTKIGSMGQFGVSVNIWKLCYGFWPIKPACCNCHHATQERAKADLDALLKDKKKLAAVLTYHVVPGKVMAATVKAGKVKTVQGSEITITTTGGVMVNNAKVIKTDIVADNGVIHVIDTVIMPK